MPCAAPCDLVVCSLRCQNLLTCGHQCPSLCGADCPSEIYCQICAPESIKNLRADLIMFTTYAEVDLSENPCVFLPCGHVFTTESLDGLMQMSEYYQLDDATGIPVALNATPKAFSYEELKTCPDCRGSLRLVPRYGRIVRGALLDESTKKFITWANQQYLGLASMMKSLQERLIETRSTFALPPVNVSLVHDSHVSTLARSTGIHGRYVGLASLRRKIEAFGGKTAAEEQPFRRVRDIVETLRRRRLQEGQTTKAFDFDQLLIQTRGSLLATSLAIRCEIVAIVDFIGVFYGQQQQQGSLQVNFARIRDVCEALINSAEATSNILQQAEGHIFWAQLAGLEYEVMESRTGNADPVLEHIKTIADAHLDSAEELCQKYPGQTSNVVDEAEDVRRLLHEAGYQSQMRMVVAAMQAEFSGTGHWYRCENGHPFTVGECGMPMESTRCPSCGSRIGGLNHQSAEGVEAAGDIEREFGNLRVDEE